MEDTPTSSDIDLDEIPSTHQVVPDSDKWRLQVRQVQLGLGVLLTDNSTISQEEPGIEPPTFRLIDNRLNPLGGGVTRVVE
ncbi:hypothetical protein DPEC_G00238800 [Dallia pectoralis]|uniref:Uncharacterized protein n=1 Tax=Dallia pectoralis TaxID=75939 RepID=A0ACC2FZ59_DALPE|nr:hypothetical protein DPEC_G00238800 [Dallia pectoralis]